MKNENPLAETNFIGKIKTSIGGGRAKKEAEVKSSNIVSAVVSMNDGMRICAEAAACCWDKKVPSDYDAKAEYVAKRVRVGHTSILEHSNLVIYLGVDDFYLKDLVEFLSICTYLNTCVMRSNQNNKFHVLVGGSLRGYSDLYISTKDLNNPVLQAVTGNLFTYSNSAAFEDIIKMGLLNKDNFINSDPRFYDTELISDTRIESNELFDIISKDDPHKFYKNLYNIDKEAASMFTMRDVIPFLSITIMFKNMSRVITQQVTRHRNGITQESQRYVDYSCGSFNDPSNFVPKYDSNHKYSIKFGPSNNMNLTLSEIGESIISIYKQLNDPSITGKEYALKREDARGFLPNNTKCRKLYMTFTFKNLLKFLELREDNAAQAEIRKYAETLGEWFRNNSEFKTKEISHNYLMPKLWCEDTISLLENIDVAEEVMDISVEDYIIAAGLDKEDDEMKEEE